MTNDNDDAGCGGAVSAACGDDDDDDDDDDCLSPLNIIHFLLQFKWRGRRIWPSPSKTQMGHWA